MFTNEFAQEVFASNHLWWHNLNTGERLNRNKGELIALLHSELSEMAEALEWDSCDSKLRHRKGEEVELADFVIRALDYAGAYVIDVTDLDDFNVANGTKRTLILAGHSICTNLLEAVRKSQATGEVIAVRRMLAWAVAYARKFRLDLNGAIVEKRAYNATREDHKREARIAAGGKQF